MQEFLTHGYVAASMDRLAISAKVSKPTLYSYFQNKEGLADIWKVTISTQAVTVYEKDFLGIRLRLTTSVATRKP